MTISRRTLLATGGSFGLLTLAACSSDPVEKAETPATDTATTDTPAPASTSSVELYDGHPVDALGTDALLTPDGIKDRPLGGKDAKVIVIEYSSPTCPHCTEFAINTYPAFKEKYIDTGEVTFLLRPFARNVLDAVVFMLADAAGPDAYHEVVNTYFHTMTTWATSETPRDEIEKIALQLGFTKESFEAALTNQDMFTALESMRNQAMEKFDVTGTPTFFINGKKIVGGPTMGMFATEIDPLLG